jgi:pimeloyl-ACP methyl ester carboxylesterase
MTSPDLQRADEPIGHELFGSGPVHVVIMNDWLCDTSTWDLARPFLDTERFTFAFTDLRGYGRSRGRTGRFALEEAAGDVLALADALGWTRLSVIGHSMSALIALHVAQHHAHRVARTVVLTPPPPRGFGADEATLSALRELALADSVTTMTYFAERFGTRLSRSWATYKALRWRASADPVAAAGYVPMFARDGLRDPTARITMPVLAITGEQDMPVMRRDVVSRALDPLCDQLVVIPLADAGHYPMQEMPPLTVALVERFLAL